MGKGRRRRAITAVVSLVVIASACGSSRSSAGVPTLQGASGANAGAQHNAQALHAAAQCIREHGIPNYADPTIGPGDVVYSDQRDLEDTKDPVRSAALEACRTSLAAAVFDPTQRPHPPAQMVRDGVREAQCLRAHGLPNWPDPKPSDTFDPGHGFQVDASAFAGAVPAGANPKQSAVFQRAIAACQAQQVAVSRDSELSNLAQGQ